MPTPPDPTATTFRATLELARKTATGLPVPDDVLEALGGGKRPKVHVTIGEHRYRSSVGSMGGRAMLPVSAENRAAAGVQAGDELEVTLLLDTEPREVVLPDDLAAALVDEPEARAFLAGLSPSAQRWFVLDVEGAKKPETRLRRVERAVTMLREGRAR